MVLYCSVGVPPVMLFYIMTPVIRGVIHRETDSGCFQGNAHLVHHTDYIQNVLEKWDRTVAEGIQCYFNVLLFVHLILNVITVKMCCSFTFKII